MKIPRFFRNFFKEQSSVKPKLSAFILALFLWLYVGLNNVIEDDIRCRIVPVNLIPGKIIANRLPDDIVINVTGKGYDLLWLHLFWKSDLRFEVDLETINQYYDFPLNDEKYLSWIKLPVNFIEAVSVNDIVSPDTMKVVLDRLIVKKVPVIGKNIEIVPESGYWQIGDVVFDPEAIEISGPEMYVRSISGIATEPKSFIDKSRDISEMCRLLVENDAVYSLPVDEVKMSVDIQKIGVKEVLNVPVLVDRKPSAVTIEVRPSTINVSLRGGVDYIKNIDADDIAASIEYDRNWRRGGEYVAVISVNVPEHIIGYDISPNNINVIVR
ncbi:hypothetical protein ACFL6I_06110 [candidate division KSB1 bacterium]